MQKIQSGGNARYMQKLGIVRNMINQQESGSTRDQMVMDELCSLLKRGCTLEEFKNAAQEFMTQEESDAPDIDNEFFSLIGLQGWSAIHSACSQNNTEVVEYLVNKRRVNPNLRGKDNWSPLEIAIQSGFFQLANLLLDDKRTQVNQVNSDMRGSALHLAAKSGYLPICQILLLKNVDLSIRDSNGLLAKQVTSNPQVKNLIEKYEEQRGKPQAQADASTIIYEEIKEEYEEDDEGTAALVTGGRRSMHHDSPKDASGGAVVTALATSMMSGGPNSPMI